MRQTSGFDPQRKFYGYAEISENDRCSGAYRHERAIREQAIRGLITIGRGAIPAVIEALDGWDSLQDVSLDINVHLADQATRILVAFGPAAVPALREALKDRRFLITWRAAEALGGIGPEAKGCRSLGGRTLV